MKAFLATDDETRVEEIRKILLRQGLDCPIANIARIDQAPKNLALAAVEMIVVVLPKDGVRTVAVLDWLANLPRVNRERIVCIGPTGDPKLMLRALRGSVDDYLDESDLETELDLALGRWRASKGKAEEAGKLIALLAPNGGSGSSTIAVNIATVLAQRHKSSLLIDLKLAAGDLAAMLELRPTYNLSDLCQNVSRMDRTLFERSLVRHDSGVQLLAPPRHYDDIAGITPEGVRQALTLARSSFPYIVVDLDHSYDLAQVEVIRQVDLLLLILRLDFVSLRNARRSLEYVERLGLNRDQLRLVVNRSGQPNEIPAAKAEEALGLKIFHYVPDDPKSVNRAGNNGVPVVIESPRSGVSKSLAKLGESVNGRHP